MRRRALALRMAAIAIAVSSPAIASTRTSQVAAGQTHIATATLGFSNVAASIEETVTSLRPWQTRRRLIMVSPAGRRRAIPLHNATNGSVSTNLYGLENGQYLLLSRFDCIELDTIRLAARSCAVAQRRGLRSTDQRCLARTEDNGAIERNRRGRWPLYLGRFDYMNGFDPPHGEFGNRFRYLGAEGASEDQAPGAFPCISN